MKVLWNLFLKSLMFWCPRVPEGSTVAMVTVAVNAKVFLESNFN